MILLSCATMVTGKHLTNYLKSRDWTKKKEADLSCEFTIFVCLDYGIEETDAFQTFSTIQKW